MALRSKGFTAPARPAAARSSLDGKAGGWGWAWQPWTGYILSAMGALPVLVLGVAAALAEPGAEGPGTFAERPEENLELVDEDEQFAPKQQTYAFNPVQARNELKVGNYYAKKGSYRAAAGRYLEATRWDPNFGEAYWRLGLARERQGSAAEAIEAYTRFLAIEPSGRKARSVRRSIEALSKTIERLPLAGEGGGADASP